MVSHIVQTVKGEDPYMEDFNLTISRPFIKGVGPIEKQNHRGGEGGWGLVGSRCVRHCSLEPNNIK